jgi:hypothetical protein
MKRKLTNKQYRCATIFVDHYSRLHFVHLQIDNTSVETVTTKRAFESFAPKYRRKNSALPLRQRAIFQQRVQTSLPQTAPATFLLWRKCTLSNGIAVEPSGTSQSACASSCCMLTLAGHRQCTLRSGHTPCTMLHSCTIACQCWRTAHQG